MAKKNLDMAKFTRRQRLKAASLEDKTRKEGVPPREAEGRAWKEASEAGWERSDISAISAASVVMENVVAFEIARALVEKFGGDSLAEMRQNYEGYLAAAGRIG